MSSRVVRFSGVGGIEVRLDPSVLVLAALVGWVFTSWFRDDHPLPTAVAMAVVGAVLVVATTFAHELGHALEARHRGIEVVAITLMLFGGVTEMHAHEQRARDDLAVAAVGPYVSLVSGALFGIVATFADVVLPARFAAPVGDVAGVLGWWNVLLAVFNLVPGAPLDGGRVLRGLLWIVLRDRMRAVTITVRLGQLLGVAIGCGGLWILSRTLGAWLPAAGLLLLGAFLVRGATSELAHARMDAAMEGRSVADLVGTRPDPQPASAAVDVGALTRLAGTADLLAVTRDDVLVGVVEVARLAARAERAQPGATYGDFAEPLDGVPSVDVDDDLHTLIERFQGPHHVVRLTHGGREVGALSEREVAGALERLRRSTTGRDPDATRGRRGRRSRGGDDGRGRSTTPTAELTS